MPATSSAKELLEGVFLVSESPLPAFYEFRAKVLASREAEVHGAFPFARFRGILGKIDSGCVLFDLSEKSHLKELSEVTALLSEKTRTGRIQLVVLNRLNHPQIQKLLDRLGSDKILKFPVSAKDLKDTLLRCLALSRKTPVEPGTVREVPPLKTADDCWIGKSSSARNIHERWIVSMLGPGPDEGSWVDVSGERSTLNEENRIWEWKPKNPGGDPFVREGVWRFQGREPELYADLWYFVGLVPSLSYFRDGKVSERRFFIESDGSLVLAANSKSALDKRELLRASMSVETHLKERVPEFGGGSFGSKQKVPGARLGLFERADKLFKSSASGELFHMVNSKEERKAHTKEAGLSNNPVTIWTARRQFLSHSTVVAEGDKPGTIEVAYPEGVDADGIRARVSESASGELFFNVNTGRSALFFAHPLEAVRFKEESMNVAIPEVLYAVQRRSHLRYACPESRPLSMQLGSFVEGPEPLICRVKDIAPDGACIVQDLGQDTQVSTELKLNPGDTLSEIGLEIYSRPIRCAAKIQWKKNAEISGKPVLLIGLKFVRMTAEDREGIRLFVMEESYDFIESVLSIHSQTA